MERPTKESELRHPAERTLLFAYIGVNVVVMALAVYIFVEGADWLTRHPFLNKQHTKIRAVAGAIVLALPALVFLRNTRRAQIGGNSVRISPNQFPQIHEIFWDHCRK